MVNIEAQINKERQNEREAARAALQKVCLHLIGYIIPFIDYLEFELLFVSEITQ